MKRLEEIRSAMREKEILTTAQAAHIKGGGKSDDKRRPRPGGKVHVDRPTTLAH